MQLIHWRLWCLWWLTAAALGAQSSPREKAITLGFRIARDGYRELMQTRGLTPTFPIATGPLPGAERTISLSYFETLLAKDYPPATGVLFYVCSERCERIVGWLITAAPAANGPEYDVIVPPAELNAGAGALRREILSTGAGARGVQLEGSPVETPAVASFRTAVRAVTQILIPSPGLAERLETLRHLIVVPAGEIGTIPFAALEPFREGEPLIEHMSISVAPSIFDLSNPVPKWSGVFQKPLVAGAPKLPESWTPLPGAEAELKSVARVLQTEPLVGSEAVQSKVAARANTADLLYFATHGLANLERPLEGFVAFTGTTQKEIGWTALQIQTSRLTASLAVLSACQTGLGQIHDAGIIGLGRAFQIAGVPRVVMSLWNVNDRGTVDLMLAFMGHVREQIPAVALRLAMLEARKSGQPISVWASFVLLGTPR